MGRNPPSTPTLWVVEQRKLWGDYGDVLISGYARRATDDGPIALHRTGPFLPPISFPWIASETGHALIVSAEFKQHLADLKLAGLTFREARKTRIIPLSWEQWNRSARLPWDPAARIRGVRPDGGEPENYLRDEEHDSACAETMSAAFEVLLPVGPIRVTRLEDPNGSYLDEFSATMAETPAIIPAISRSHWTHGYIIVSDDLKAWLETNAGDWVRFSPVRVEG